MPARKYSKNNDLDSMPGKIRKHIKDAAVLYVS